MFVFLALLAAQSGAAAPPSEKKVCRADAATGSIMPKRICHTPAEWRALDKADDGRSVHVTGDVLRRQPGVSPGVTGGH